MKSLKPTKILTSRQLLFLRFFGQSPLRRYFYLSGGTALCGFYIPYRYSEDLDFFSGEEINLPNIVVWLRSIKPFFKFTSFDVQTSFNRNLLFIKHKHEMLKMEFTYFPFSPKKSNSYGNIAIDSIEDIALNKLFTIYQRPRLRDYMDLYVIIEQKKFRFQQLRLDAKAKFDWDIDPIQLGSQLLKVKKLKDVPRLAQPFDYEAMENYFLKIASSLKQDILK